MQFFLIDPFLALFEIKPPEPKPSIAKSSDKLAKCRYKYISSVVYLFFSSKAMRPQKRRKGRFASIDEYFN